MSKNTHADNGTVPNRLSVNTPKPTTPADSVQSEIKELEEFITAALQARFNKELSPLECNGAPKNKTPKLSLIDAEPTFEVVADKPSFSDIYKAVNRLKQLVMIEERQGELGSAH